MAKVLVMLPNNPGDVLMATPAVRQLKAAGHSVHFLVDSACAEMVAHNPHIDAVHLFQRRKIKSELSDAAWKKGLTGLRSFTEKLRKEKFDRVVNLFQGDHTAILAALVPAAEFIGPRMGRSGTVELVGNLTALLYTIPYARRYAPAHASDFYSLMCGVPPDGRGVELHLPERSKTFAQKLIKENGLNADRLVVIHPCSAHLKKEWPHEHAAVLLKLLGDAGYSVVLTGSARERDRVDAILAKAGNPKAVNLCGRATFLESAALIGRAAVLVSGDTVAMHMAAALGVRTISVFAPTSPIETGPYAAGCTVFSADCLCHGNYSGFCPVGRRCTGRVSPQTVFAEIEGREPAPENGCTRWVSRFEPDTGFIDYVNNGCSAYSAAARVVFRKMNSKPDLADAAVLRHDESMLRRLNEGLKANIACLQRMKAARTQEALKGILAENAVIERGLNSLTGIGALLSAYLRFRNNAVQSARLDELTAGFLENGRETLMLTEALRQKARPAEDGREPPSVKVLLTSRNREEVTEPMRRAVKQGVEYAVAEPDSVDDRSSALNRKIREESAEFVLLLRRGVQVTPGFIHELVDAMAREPEAAVCAAKVLNLDDTLLHAAFEITKKKEFVPLLAHRKRFDHESTLFREVPGVEPYAVLIRRTAFLQCNGFEENYTPLYRFLDFCLKCQEAGLKIIFCPDAEVYYQEPADFKAASQSDLERDHWRLLEKWKDSSILAQIAEPLGALSGSDE